MYNVHRKFCQFHHLLSLVRVFSLSSILKEETMYSNLYRIGKYFFHEIFLQYKGSGAWRYFYQKFSRLRYNSVMEYHGYWPLDYALSDHSTRIHCNYLPLAISSLAGSNLKSAGASPM